MNNPRCVLTRNCFARLRFSFSGDDGSSAATAAAAAASAAQPAPAVAAPAPPAAVVSSVSPSFRSGLYENGLITACNNLTYDEVMRRRLIGLPRAQLDLISKLRSKHSAIFLLNMETREMFGVFEADGGGGMDLEPEAWAGQSYNGRKTSRFPAQVNRAKANRRTTRISGRCVDGVATPI